MGDHKVVELRREPELKSAVMRVASRRVDSGSMVVDPKRVIGSIIVELTETAIRGVRDAAAARESGDEAGAVVLLSAARRAQDAANDAFDSLTRI